MKDFDRTLEEYVSQRQKELIGRLSDLVRQPSVSSTGEGVSDCCDKIIARMEEIGIRAQRHEVTPYPIITGQLGEDPEKKTVFVYAHYDVQPTGDLSLWRSPPFEPTIRDGAIYGRGTADNKGPLSAHLCAAEFWLREFGELPVNVKFLFEGCEESNSAGLREFLEEHQELLRSDVTYFSDGSKNHNDTPIIALGVKGMLYVELRLTAMTRDLHSQYAPVLPSASWQMVELLGKLKKDGVVQVPGFYDDVLPITPEEKAIYDTLPDVSDDLRRTYNASPSYDPKLGYYGQLNGTPSFNLAGIASGYTGEGSATVLTSTAMAKLDMRLVANQDGEKILQSLKQYIKDLGYDNVEVICHGITPPSKTPLDTPFLEPVRRATERVFGKSMVYPNRPSTAPDYFWTSILKTPTIQVRWCDFDSDNHAPNEHLRLENYLRGIKLTATAFQEIGNL
ncbi:MAG: M20/M25/M40 family metallo-hydrolase [Angelakisella sp.]|jgi:acetylornithine deacetylase/succinyl-diaminopimelate desuccinylase-like protein|nr:M20/M25/M40 family metallo-hydrolase [Angelakisella sp.]